MPHIEIPDSSKDNKNHTRSSSASYWQIQQRMLHLPSNNQWISSIVAGITNQILIQVHGTSTDQINIIRCILPAVYW
jgi:hypothetical protein